MSCFVEREYSEDDRILFSKWLTTFRFTCNTFLGRKIHIKRMGFYSLYLLFPSIFTWTVILIIMSSTKCDKPPTFPTTERE
jgi:hypothetical protein